MLIINQLWQNKSIVHFVNFIKLGGLYYNLKLF